MRTGPDGGTTPTAVPGLWDRLPPDLRAIASGLAVFFVLQLGWNIALGVNLRVTPAVPWHVPAGLAYLWVAFRWLGGRWPPAATAPRRAGALRARALGGAEWRSAAWVCAAACALIISVAMLNYRFVEVPGAATDLGEIPPPMAYSMLGMLSVVAGASEEAGFRGYMQSSLERRHAPWLAVLITAFVFWLAHLNHPSGLARMPSLLTMGLVLGGLAYATRSIYPPMITHILSDAVVYLGGHSGVGPQWLWSPPLFPDSGFDSATAGTLVVATGAASLSIVGMRQLRAVSQRSLPGGENECGP